MAEREEAEEEEIVKAVIEHLRSYLQNSLTVDGDFVSELRGRHLLSGNDAERLRLTLDNKGKNSALYALLDHISAFYDLETLEKFCVCLDHYADGRPILGKIASKIREEVKKHQPDQHSEDDVPSPSKPINRKRPEPSPSIDGKRSKVEDGELDMYDKTPSDVGLLGVTNHIPDKWTNVAIALGVPKAQVNAFKLRHDGGLDALAYWRDGRCKEHPPTTWRYLLEKIAAQAGKEVADDVKRDVCANREWSKNNY